MTNLTAAPEGLRAYDFHEGAVRARPVLALTQDGDTLAPYVLGVGRLRRLDASSVLLGMAADDEPSLAQVAALTEIGRLELGEKHPLDRVAQLVDVRQDHGTHDPQHATDVVAALNADPVMRALGRAARDEMDDTGSGGDHSARPRRYVIIEERLDRLREPAR